ncbi:MAG TPA: cytochrome c-type biogenesis protein CcmH [Anaerolineales bacterium]|nr:cytochrome c-type biogenesis protein CcmH [Anaerolineales bacterium]
MMNQKSIRKLLRITLYVSLLLLVIFGASTRAFAQGEEPTDDEVNRIAKQLYCPVCESTPLDVCPTEACRQWRDLIRQMLTEGKNEDEIKQYFVAQYGARVLDEPPNRLVSYAIPVVAFLLGAFLLFRGFRMWIKPVATEAGSSEEEAQPAAQDDYIQKFEEEMKKRK